MSRFLILPLALLSLVLVLSAGLPAAEEAHDHADHAHEGHDHAHEQEKPPHGGILREVGETHLELVAAEGGAFTLHLYDEHLKPKAIAAKPLTLQVKPAGAAALTPVTLAPAIEGTADTFTGTVAALADVTAFEAVLRIELDGKAQRVVFARK